MEISISPSFDAIFKTIRNLETAFTQSYSDVLECTPEYGAIDISTLGYRQVTGFGCGWGPSMGPFTNSRPAGRAIIHACEYHGGFNVSNMGSQFAYRNILLFDDCGQQYRFSGAGTTGAVTALDVSYQRGVHTSECAVDIAFSAASDEFKYRLPNIIVDFCKSLTAPLADPLALQKMAAAFYSAKRPHAMPEPASIELIVSEIDA
jgi:hypothetical protein